MPGASYVRGKLVQQAIGCGKLIEHDLDLRAREVLKLVKKAQKLGIPENAPEETRESEETSQLLRKIGADGIVLMKNENNVLPFKKDKSIAIIGPNAKFAAYCGGGSAALTPYYAKTPFQGISAQAKDFKYSLGVVGWNKLPFISWLTESLDGKQGLTMKTYAEPPSDKDRKKIDEVYVRQSEAILIDYKPPGVSGNLYYIDFEGTLVPEESGEYEFSLSCAGTAKLFIDGKEVVDNETNQRPGDSFFGHGTAEETGSVKLEAGKEYKIRCTFGTAPTMKFHAPGTTTMGSGGLRIGGERKVDAKEAHDAAVKLAGEVDQVVICAGLNSDWESEGYDRPHMDLPPGSDELIAAVTAANPNTAVVIQSGTPVTMPWLSKTPALLQAWYGGNETGNAIADVLFGDVNPSGKAPLSFPVRNEDNPAYLNFRSERGRVLYGEDVYIGYRFYERTKLPVEIPFGHGLSYTKFSMKDLSVTDDETTIKATVTVTNDGDYDGAQVVQVYVGQRKPSINRPVKELKGFTKVVLKKGESKQAEVSFSKKYGASFWDEHRDAWIMEKDVYDVLVGDSSADTPLKGDFEVKKTDWWTGL